MATASIETYSYQAIQKGSLSFHFASRIFNRQIRDRVVKLYAWCRYIDNEIDDAPKTCSREQLKVRLQELSTQSFDVYDTVRFPLPLPPALQAFRQLRSEVDLPVEPARELIKGMAMDLSIHTYQDFDELYLYCYRVAGVVGLMMSHVMGVRCERALKHAVDLGIAMQLTNICRDVGEDAAMGRLYLPISWLREAGIHDNHDVMHPNCRSKLVQVVKKTLDHADVYYHSGDAGLKFLPLRCAIAVAIARDVYAAIGDRVRTQGGSAWNKRVWIPLPLKLLLVIKAMARVATTIPYRLKGQFR